MNESIVQVFAAASLRDAVDEVAAAYQQETGVRVVTNYAPSGTLARQLVAGAEADVFLSADRRWVDFLGTRSQQVKALLRNRLVLIANAESDWTLDQIEQLPGVPFRHLCIGHPASVPAGAYAQSALEGVSIDQRTLWEAVQPRIATTTDIKRVVALIEADRSLLGIVYATDAFVSPDVRVVCELPGAALYFAVRVSDADESMDNSFFRYLDSTPARDSFQRAGFQQPDATNIE